MAITTTRGNHVQPRRIDGVDYLFWEDTRGNGCGRTRKWKLRLQLNDEYHEIGDCVEGYKLYEIKYAGQAEQVIE